MSKLILLLEMPGIRWSIADAHAIKSRARGAVLDVMTAVDQYETWVYATLEEVDDVVLQDNSSVVFSRLLGIEVQNEFRVRQLDEISCLGSFAEGLKQPWRYVAQTDIQPEVEEEFNLWFEQEHLPRLASITGTEFACRYRTNGSPRYMACYDLVEREIHGGLEWKAAVSTPWRDKIHHSFLNSKRMMFKRLA